MDTLLSANDSRVQPTEAILSVRDVRVVFSGFQAIKGVSLDVGEQEIVTIIGPKVRRRGGIVRCAATAGVVHTVVRVAPTTRPPTIPR